ncbi:MAG: hypothetical protein Ct9H90mP27_6300 [Gammaproteobacteria bacterium]|nr:MAG: hypothetical protein Ct9H90mP27_6300 [Gammaproteobacteria bacterium]
MQGAIKETILWVYGRCNRLLNRVLLFNLVIDLSYGFFDPKMAGNQDTEAEQKNSQVSIPQNPRHRMSVLIVFQ